MECRRSTKYAKSYGYLYEQRWDNVISLTKNDFLKKN